ncbi:unnamed protein product [Heligmosomoides polygyrus]|uniref:Uncharacterized protein n=1 Tax=Heligmosomoides polygyrus TaxID=6339 RepID=A0A183FJQ5_HELPZ|nr:unnamed protein product [Heligmosomoides polygyrus]
MNDVGDTSSELGRSLSRVDDTCPELGRPLRDTGNSSSDPSQHGLGDTSLESGWLLLGVYERPDGQMDGPTDGQTDGQTEGQMEGETQPLTLLYIVGQVLRHA